MAHEGLGYCLVHYNTENIRYPKFCGVDKFGIAKRWYNFHILQTDFPQPTSIMKMDKVYHSTKEVRI